MQLELLPMPQKSQQAVRVWQRLKDQQRTALIAAIARLMRKMIPTEPRKNPDEQ